MKRVRHSRRARRDLIDLWLRIATANPAADAVYDRLEARVRILEQFPEAGPLKPEIAVDARILVEPPYLILYRVVPDGVSNHPRVARRTTHRRSTIQSRPRMS